MITSISTSYTTVGRLLSNGWQLKAACVLFTLLFFGNSTWAVGSGPDSVKLANDFFQLGMETYNYTSKKDAKDLFVQATNYNPALAKAHFMVGKCIIETVNRGESLDYFLQAYDLNPKVDEDILNYIAKSYHYSFDFDNAMAYYTRYRDFIEGLRIWQKQERLAAIDLNIRECVNGKLYKANPVNVQIRNLGKALNTEFPEYGPTVSADESVMIFTSRRSDNVSGDRANDNQYYEDIYIASRAGGGWGKATNIGKPINTDYHDASIGLSPNGQILFIYKDAGNGDIYTCQREGGTYGKPKPLAGSINSSYSESSASITADGSKLYFTSARPGGQGGLDIYVSYADKKGRWGLARNVGSNINTPYNEDGVFISADGTQLYFSSRGHPGMGGYDIYRSVLKDDNTWSDPVNLGYPINSVDDDIYFVLAGNSKRAYYSSIKADGMGEKDLYLVDLTNHRPATIDELKKRTNAAPGVGNEPGTEVGNDVLQPVVLRVKVTEKGGGATKALIEVSDAATGRLIIPDGLSGGVAEYVFESDQAQNLHVSVWKDGFLNDESDIKVPAVSSKPNTITKPVALQKIEIGAKGLVNLYFDSKSTRPKSYRGAEPLVKFMRQNPALRVRIVGHTDNVGSADYNRSLSEARAKGIKAYIVNQGIDPGRIEYQGLGYDEPVAGNTDEAGRKLNRRTEFVIVE